jgi:hypothetical protein
MTKRPTASCRTTFALSAALAISGACGATHVLGPGDGGPNDQDPGSNASGSITGSLGDHNVHFLKN